MHETLNPFVLQAPHVLIDTLFHSSLSRDSLLQLTKQKSLDGMLTFWTSLRNNLFNGLVDAITF